MRAPGYDDVGCMKTRDSVVSVLGGSKMSSIRRAIVVTALACGGIALVYNTNAVARRKGTAEKAAVEQTAGSEQAIPSSALRSLKWRNIGPGKVQIRLPVAAGSRPASPAAFLCEYYEKNNPSYEQRRLARFKTHMNLIAVDQYQYRGSL